MKESLIEFFKHLFEKIGSIVLLSSIIAIIIVLIMPQYVYNKLPYKELNKWIIFVSLLCFYCYLLSQVNDMCREFKEKHLKRKEDKESYKRVKEELPFAVVQKG